MKRVLYSFMDIIKLNGNNWDKAYFMLEHFKILGLLRKEIRGPEDIIYHVTGRLYDDQLIYDQKFQVPERESLPRKFKKN